LVALPVVVTGGLLGMRAGILAGLFAFLFNLSLAHLLFGGSVGNWANPVSLTISVLILLLGTVAGWVHDLDRRTKQEVTRHKRVEEALEQRAAQLELLNDIGEKIAAVLEIDRVLDRATRLVQERFGYDHVALLTVERGRDDLVMRAITGSLAPLFPPDYRLRLNRGMIGWVGRHGETLLANDVSAEPHYFNHYPEVISTRSELCVPIRIGEEIVGVLDVQSPHLNAFDENDVMVLETLVGQIAVALENARLYQAVERELSRRKRINATLRENEKRFRSITETAGDAIIIFDSREEIFFWNQAAKDILGYRADETQGKLLDSIMLSQFSHVLRREMEHVISTGASEFVGKTIEVAGIGKDGGEFPLEISLATWETEEETFFTVIARDIKERKRVEESLAAIYALGQNLVLFRDVEEIAQAVVDAAWQVLHLPLFSLWLLDEEQGILALQAHTKMPMPPTISRLPLDSERGVMAAAVRSGESIYLPDVSQDSCYVGGSFQACSEACAPLKAGGRVIGVLNSESDQLNAFSPADIQLLEALANVAAVALENAWLHEAVEQELTERKRAEQGIKRHAAQLAALYEVSATIASLLTPEEIFEAIVSNLSEALGYRLVGIYLIGDGTLELRAHVGHGSSLSSGVTCVPLEKGVVGRTARTGQAQLVADVEQDPDFFSCVPGITSEVCVPLKRGDRVWGVLNVESDRVDKPLDTSDVQLLTLLGSHIVIAIENARLFEETRNRAERLAVVNRIARAASATLNIDNLVEMVYQETVPVFQADAFFVALYDKEANELDFRIMVDEGVREPPERRPLRTGFASLVITEKKPLIVRDLEQERDRLPPGRKFGTMKPSASLLGAPLLIGERVIGVISVQSYRPNVWGEEDELLLFTIADQVAVALENIRLFEETQTALAETEEQARCLVLLSEMAEQLGQTTDRGEILDVAAAKTSQIFAADRASVAMLTSDGDSFEIYALRGEEGAIPVGTRLRAEGREIGRAVQEKRLIIVPDDQSGDMGDIRSSMIAPLLAGGEAFGTLNVASKYPDAYTQSDGNLLLQVASLLSSAIESGRLFEEARSRAERLAAVNRIAQAAGSTLHLDDLVNIVYQEIAPLFQPDAFFIALYDEKANELEFPIWVDTGVQEKLPRRLSLREGFTSFVVAEKKPLIVRDFEQEREHLPPQLLIGAMKPALSWLGAPMLIGERVIGVISVQSYRSYAWDKEDEQLLFTIADQVAVAIENARLYETIEQELIERERADKALQESEIRFRSIAETAGDAIIIFDEQENIFYWNQAAQAIFGFGAGETQGKLLVSILSDPFRQVFRREMERIVSAGPSNDNGKPIEVMGIRKDGDVFPLELSLATWGIGRETYFTAIARDVTERKQVEESLERRAIQLALINDISGKIASVLELDSLLNRAARLVQENFGYHHVALFVLDRKRGELVMRASAGDFAHLFSPDHHLKLGQGVVGWVGQRGETLLANDVDAEPRYVNLYPDVLPTRSELSVPIRVGEEIVGVLDVQSPQLHAFSRNDVMVMETLAHQIAVAINNARLFEETQYRVRELKLLHDVGLAAASGTRLEETLFAAAEALSVQLESAAVMLMLLDSESNTLHMEAGVPYPPDMSQDWRIPVGEGITGWVAQHGEPVIVPDVSQDPRFVGIEEGVLTRSELCVPLVAGQQVIGVLNVESSQPNAFTNDDLQLLSTLASNLTALIERARLFEAVEVARAELQQQAEALARSNTELEQFAYVASHDLQEPLRMVTSYLQLLERRYKGELDEDADEFIAFAVDGATRMQELINSLLKYSRVSTRGRPFEFVDSAQVLEHVLFSLQMAIEENHAVVTHDDLPTVMADGTQLTQVFQNLISNAIKFHGDRSPKIHVGAERSDGEWLFWVRDDGIGIAPQHFERIFRIFQRLHNRADYPGTGIGLTICKKVVERHGGRIWVESEPGQGATFYFTISDKGDDSL
jgi:PAS domain S-box-containing protein